MKIYNKKYFFLGSAAVVLAIAHLFLTDAPNAADWLRIAVLGVTAASLFYTSLNRQQARSAAINDQDEREQLLKLKAYRTAFWAGVVLLAAAGYALSLNGSPGIQPMAAGFLLSAILLVAIHWFLRLLNL